MFASVCLWKGGVGGLAATGQLKSVHACVFMYHMKEELDVYYIQRQMSIVTKLPDVLAQSKAFINVDQ